MNTSRSIPEDGKERDSTQIVELCETSSPAEASAIRAVLEEAGIQAEVVGNLAGGAFDLPMNVSVLKVWVHAGELERARDVLAEVRRHHGEEGVELREEA